MNLVKYFLEQLIAITEEELSAFLSLSQTRKIKRNEDLSSFGKIPNEIFFILSGGVRFYLIDVKGNERTIHFAFENQVACEYERMMKRMPAIFAIQALEATEVLVFPLSAIEWAFANFKEGQKLGRIMSEQHFFLFENRIVDLYLRNPKERYDNITTIFPNIHNRVPQHMIASYLGITSVHLSRLKKTK